MPQPSHWRGWAWIGAVVFSMLAAGGASNIASLAGGGLVVRWVVLSVAFLVFLGAGVRRRVRMKDLEQLSHRPQTRHERDDEPIVAAAYEFTADTILEEDEITRAAWKDGHKRLST